MSASSSSALESEDLDNIPLVRMSDIQPAREIIIESSETIVASEIEYGDGDSNDDSNIDSMSVKSEEVVGAEGTDDDGETDSEMMAPEFVSDEVPIDIPESQAAETKPPPGSWPTLEILPGGVIKHKIEKEEDQELDGTDATDSQLVEDSGDLMYACAKCPERFKYLFCLVKHVRWHEDERKKLEGPDLSKLNSLERDLISIKRARLHIEKKYRKQKSKVMARIANALGEIDDFPALRSNGYKIA